MKNCWIFHGNVWVDLYSIYFEYNNISKIKYSKAEIIFTLMKKFSNFIDVSGDAVLIFCWNLSRFQNRKMFDTAISCTHILFNSNE